METFDWPNFTWTTKYPESSAKVKFGRGYEFASKPKGPDQVTYVLRFRAMKAFEGADGLLDPVPMPEINVGRLEAFYNVHRLYEKFILPLPGKGDLVVRFAKPFEYTIAEGGLGTTDAFTIEVCTQP